jgi:Flp pilus assembly protein TadD
MTRKQTAGLWAAVAVFAAAAGGLAVHLDLGLPGDDGDSVARQQLQRGIHLYDQGALAEAQAELRSVLRADPKEWRAPFYVGVIQIQRGRYGLAIPYLERALGLNPTEPKIVNALGVTYFKLGRLDMAKGYFRASLALDPANADANALFETMAKLQRRAALAETAKVL